MELKKVGRGADGRGWWAGCATPSLPLLFSPLYFSRFRGFRHLSLFVLPLTPPSPPPPNFLPPPPPAPLLTPLVCLCLSLTHTFLKSSFVLRSFPYSSSIWHRFCLQFLCGHLVYLSSLYFLFFFLSLHPPYFCPQLSARLLNTQASMQITAALSLSNIENSVGSHPPLPPPLSLPSSPESLLRRAEAFRSTMCVLRPRRMMTIFGFSKSIIARYTRAPLFLSFSFSSHSPSVVIMFDFTQHKESN